MEKKLGIDQKKCTGNWVVVWMLTIFATLRMQVGTNYLILSVYFQCFEF